MNICIIVKSVFPFVNGGLEVYTYRLAEFLKKNNHDVTIITFNVLGINPNDYHDLPFRIFFVNAIYTNWKKTDKNKVPDFYHNLDKTYHFDLIISEGFGDFMITDKNRTAHFIEIIHGLIMVGYWKQLEISIKLLIKFFFSFKFKFSYYQLRSIFGSFKNFIINSINGSSKIERMICMKSDAVIVINDDLKKYLDKKHSEYKDNVHLIYNGIDINQFYPIPDTDIKLVELKKKYNINRDHTIIFMGRLDFRKGSIQILPAIQELIKDYPDLVLLIIGTGNLKNNLREFIVKHNLEKNIIMPGYIPDEDFNLYLNLGSIYVFPSITQEGLPLSLIETMSTGLVPIAYNNMGVRSVINSNENGFIIKSGSKKQLIESVKLLFDNHEKVEILSKNARNTVIEKFNKDKMQKSILEIIENIDYKSDKIAIN